MNEFSQYRKNYARFYLQTVVGGRNCLTTDRVCLKWTEYIQHIQNLLMMFL